MAQVLTSPHSERMRTQQRVCRLDFSATFEVRDGRKVPRTPFRRRLVYLLVRNIQLRMMAGKVEALPPDGPIVAVKF
jgi:hypothetical protein